MADRYWVGGSGTWNNSSTANWAATSGGASGASAPTTADNVFFDANSGTAATVSIAASAVCNASTINKADIILSLVGSPTFVGVLTLTTGSISLNSYTLTLLNFISNNTNTRSVAFGTGKIVATGSGSAWDVRQANFTCTGSRVVDLTYTGAVLRVVRHGYTVVYSESNGIYLNVIGGTGELRIGNDGASTLIDLICTGFTGLLKWGLVYIYGNMSLSAGATTIPFDAGNVNFAPSFVATTGSKTITTNGVTLNNIVYINGIGGTWVLQDDMTIATAYYLRLVNGTFDANNKNVTLGALTLAAGTKTLTLGSGTWTVTGTVWDTNTNVSGLTVSASTGIISMTSASAKTFAGGAKTWPTLNQGGSGALTIQQSNTFANITDTVQPATVTLTAGTTQTVSAFSLAGTAGNLITLNTNISGVQATLSDSSGVNSVSFVSIKDINATGGAIWDAPTTNGNVDAGNNTGWNFGIPFSYDIEFSPALRSFTERKHF